MLARKHKHRASYIADNSPHDIDICVPTSPICAPSSNSGLSRMNIVNANSHNPPFASVFDLPPPPPSSSSTTKRTKKVPPPPPFSYLAPASKSSQDTLSCPSPSSDPSDSNDSSSMPSMPSMGETKSDDSNTQFPRKKHSQTWGGKRVLQIEIDDIDMKMTDKQRHKHSHVSNASTKSSKNAVGFLELSRERVSQILNDSKKPYILMILLTMVFVALLVLYFVDNDYLLLGLLPICISFFSIIVMCCILFYYRKLFIFQNEFIFNISMETEKIISQKECLTIENSSLLKDNEMLTNSLKNNSDELRKQKRTIIDLKSMIANSSCLLDDIANRSSTQSVHNNNNNNNNINVDNNNNKIKYNLLRGFRKGQMEIQMECAEICNLVDMLSVVVSCITLLPFGMTSMRKKLQRILERKINENAFLKMHFHFFLMSFYGCTDVKRLFGNHRIMKSIRETSSHYNYQWNRDRKASVLSDVSNPSINNPMSPNHNHAMDCEIMDFGQSYQPCNGGNGIVHNEDDVMDNNQVICVEQTVVFTEKDPIKLFRLPLDKCAGPGFRWVIPKRLQYRFFDPISGAGNIEQLCVRKIFNSNAKPLLIDCYCNSAISSSFILKRGDDLRKDAAVLQMFAFMNCIWAENGLNYKGVAVESLNYRTYPIGPDIGIIELVPNCIELNKVLSLKQSLKSRKNVCNYNRLLASAAAAYICAFVMGIRDRHDDNILIETVNYNLFHIDFGYMFGDRVSLDTAKMAVTSDLKKMFDIYKYGWNDFINVSCNAWLLLRSNASELIDYARVVFAFLFETNEIEMFLRDSLKLDLTDQVAQSYIHGKLKNAPKQWKTKIKNVVHGLAQKIH